MSSSEESTAEEGVTSEHGSSSEHEQAEEVLDLSTDEEHNQKSTKNRKSRN